jgi:hypothetical protein
LTKNNLTLTVPSDGTLKVYARTGSSSATDRNIVLTQNGTELVNKILLESEAVSVPMTDDKGDTKDTKVKTCALTLAAKATAAIRVKNFFIIVLF